MLIWTRLGSYGVEVGTLRGFLERKKEALGRAFDD
jgi:hypothetical protein